MIRRTVNALVAVAILSIASTADAQELDPEQIYRVDPTSQQLVATPADGLKPGYIYKYHNPQLKRHVWGFAKEDGSFLYAFGPGTRMPTDRFDLQISTQDARALVEERIPGLSKSLDRLGQDIHLQLGPDDRWKLYPSASVSTLYDLKSLERWEWHGKRRVAVLHTSGRQWQYENGRYVPARLAWATLSQ